MKRFRHRGIRGKAVAAPVDRELLASGRCRTGKQHSLILPSLLLDRAEHRAVVEESIVVVHIDRVASVMIDDVHRNPLTEVRLDCIDTRLKKFPDLSGEPRRSIRVCKVDKRHPRLPVVHLLDPLPVSAHQEIPLFHAFTEHICVLSDIWICPAANLQSLFVIFVDDPLRIRKRNRIPDKIAPVEPSEPVAVKVEHREWDIPLLHAFHQGVSGLLVIARLEGGREPQPEAPLRRKGRTSRQFCIDVNDVLRRPAVDDVKTKLFSRNREADILHFFRIDLVGDLSCMVYKHPIMLRGHVEWDILIADRAGGPAVLIPHIHHLPVLDKWCEALPETVDGLSRLDRQFCFHIGRIVLSEIIRNHVQLSRLFIHPEVGEIAETTGGQQSSICLKPDIPILPAHAYLHVPCRENRLVLQLLYLNVVRFCMQFKAGFLLVIRHEMKSPHLNVVVRTADDIDIQHGDIQCVRPASDRPLRRRNPDSMRNPFDGICLRCIACLYTLLAEPVPFGKLHDVFSSVSVS